jgi:hypothetical protein
MIRDHPIPAGVRTTLGYNPHQPNKASGGRQTVAHPRWEEGEGEGVGLRSTLPVLMTGEIFFSDILGVAHVFHDGITERRL